MYMGPLAIFPLWGVLMGHCAGKIAVYGTSGYFSFMGCANGPLWRGPMQLPEGPQAPQGPTMPLKAPPCKIEVV
jgi:hypothetical protein